MATKDENELNIFGKWVVSTEADEEGRSPYKQLGTHEGFIDDIALELSGKAFYGLHFKKFNPEEEEIAEELKKQKPKYVEVSIEGLKEDNLELLAIKMEKKFSERPVVIEKSNFYKCFRIRRKNA